MERKYKIGDKVRIVSKWPGHVGQNSEGKMDKWLGKVMTIRAYDLGSYHMKEDLGEHYGGGWTWSDKMIAGPANDTDKKIVITVEGRETLARLYEGDKVIKRATAKCSPEDKFDFDVGAKLAYERLMEPKFKPGNKVVVTGDTCCHGYPEGKILTLRKPYVSTLCPVHMYNPWCVEEGSTYIVEANFEPYDKSKHAGYSGKVVCISSAASNLLTTGKIYEFVNGHLTYDNGCRSGDKCNSFDDVRVKFASKFIELVED